MLNTSKIIPIQTKLQQSVTFFKEDTGNSTFKKKI